MDKIVYSNILGVFLFKGERILDKKLFKDINDGNRERYEKEFLKIPRVEKKDIVFPKLKEYRDKLCEFNIKVTKEDLKNSVNEDNLIIQTINNSGDLNKVINLLSKRLREWYSLYFPELNERIENNETYVKLLLTKTKEQLAKEFNVESVGARFDKKDIEPITKLAEEIKRLMELKEREKDYLESIMGKYCPNLKEVAGVNIAAELIAHTGSLERLAEMSSSTIQLLGAEKALFRHLKNKSSSCPKHGIIINHPLLVSAKQKEHGRIARHLASAISISAKVDYFHKGEKSNETGKKLNEKLKRLIMRQK